MTVLARVAEVGVWSCDSMETLAPPLVRWDA